MAQLVITARTVSSKPFVDVLVDMYQARAEQERPRPVLGELSAEAKASRAPLRPEELIDAKCDRIHRDPGGARAAQTVRSIRSKKVEEDAGTKTVTLEVDGDALYLEHESGAHVFEHRPDNDGERRKHTNVCLVGTSVPLQDNGTKTLKVRIYDYLSNCAWETRTGACRNLGFILNGDFGRPRMFRVPLTSTNWLFIIAETQEHAESIVRDSNHAVERTALSTCFGEGEGEMIETEDGVNLEVFENGQLVSMTVGEHLKRVNYECGVFARTEPPLFIGRP